MTEYQALNMAAKHFFSPYWPLKVLQSKIPCGLKTVYKKPLAKVVVHNKCFSSILLIYGLLIFLKTIRKENLQ